jgi:hypothetical protein
VTVSSSWRRCCRARRGEPRGSRRPPAGRRRRVEPMMVQLAEAARSARGRLGRPLPLDHQHSQGGGPFQGRDLRRQRAGRIAQLVGDRRARRSATNHVPPTALPSQSGRRWRARSTSAIRQQWGSAPRRLKYRPGYAGAARRRARTGCAAWRTRPSR